MRGMTFLLKFNFDFELYLRCSCASSIQNSVLDALSSVTVKVRANSIVYGVRQVGPHISQGFLPMMMRDMKNE